MRKRTQRSIVGRLAQRLFVGLAALALTVLFFLVVPLIQAIGKQVQPDTELVQVDAGQIEPPPPPPPEEKPEEEPEPEEKPPELLEEAPPLDLAQLELALNPGFGDGWMAGDFSISLGAASGGKAAVDALFSLADLDQEATPIYQPQPALDTKLKKRTPATVWLIFVVDENGRVDMPRVQSSTDPAFEATALTAIKQWKFEPGKRGGKPVTSRARLPMSFPEQ